MIPNRRNYSLLLLLLSSAMIHGRELLIDDPGGPGVNVHLMQKVPNVLGEPGKGDPRIRIDSGGLPVSILRYNDNLYLSGGEPIAKEDIYVIVKSNCSDPAAFSPTITTTESFRDPNYGGLYDENAYTDSISVVLNPDPGTELAQDDDQDFFPLASTFLAYFNYTSFWCEAQQYDQEPEEPPQLATFPPTRTESNQEEDKEEQEQKNSLPDETSSSSACRTGALATALVGLVVSFLWGDSTNVGVAERRNKTVRFWGGLATVGVLVLMVQVIAPQTVLESKQQVSRSLSSSDNSEFPPEHRRLQETCWAAVEVIVDGCRRANHNDDVDLVVSAPRVRIQDAEVQQLAQSTDPDNQCTQLYEAAIEFPPPTVVLPISETIDISTQNPTPVVAATAAEELPVIGEHAPEQPGANSSVYWIPSISQNPENFDAGLVCARAIEGRPFVDSTGRQLSASIQHNQNNNAHGPSWSKPASTDANNDDNEKESLKQQIVKTAHTITNDGSNPHHPRHLLGIAWEQRALGEHASIPAFSAFSIALLSNNAPHTLVNDALQAAMDEVRHAKTSFEVASMLLGRTVEPGPLPPSHHDFGPDLVQLAVAAAKEGCIDETLSAFAAAQEAMALLHDQGLDDATKFMLREKLVQIALEETRHSALAWRTVQWACQSSADACAAVQREAFGAGSFSSYLDQAFEKRFGGVSKNTNHNEHNTKLLKDAWTQVHKTLVPFVTASEDVDQQSQVICGKRLSREMDQEEPVALGYEALLEHMSRSIIEGTMCSPL